MNRTEAIALIRDAHLGLIDMAEATAKINPQDWVNDDVLDLEWEAISAEALAEAKEGQSQQS